MAALQDKVVLVTGASSGLGAQTIWTQSGVSAPGVKDPKGVFVPDGELQAAQHIGRLYEQREMLIASLTELKRWSVSDAWTRPHPITR